MSCAVYRQDRQAILFLNTVFQVSSFSCFLLQVSPFHHFWFWGTFFRSTLCILPLLCWPIGRCQWNCGCHCELDSKWWRHCWFLPHQHYHQCSPDSIWGAPEYHQCQCHTVWAQWFHCRLWVQHYSTWCQLWGSRGGWKWASDNYSSRYVHFDHSMIIFSVDVEEKKEHYSLLLWTLC